jgi:endonuclease YncB( thermonuclease family)
VSSAAPLLRFSVAILFTVMMVGGAVAQRRSPSVLVRQVLDGDTIDVVSVGRVRLLGIDAPEIGRGLDTSAPFAREAHERLASLVTSRWVRLEYEDLRDDTYGRRLAYLFLEDGQFVNELLVREGLARVVARQELKRLGQLKRAEAAAQTSRRGIWGGRPIIPTESLRPPRQKPRRSRRGSANEPGKRPWRQSATLRPVERQPS